MKYFYDANAGQKDLISRYKALILLVKFLSCWVRIHALIFRKDKKGNKKSSLTSCF